MKQISILIPIRVIAQPFEFLIKHMVPCLEGACRQEGIDCEIIVTDLGSTIPYAEQIAQICDRYEVKLTTAESDVWNLSKTRNVGADNAGTDKFLFIDCDCVLPSDYAKTHFDLLNTREGIFTCSYFRDTRWGVPVTSDMEKLLPFAEKPRTFSQSHIGIKKQDFYAIGKYDEGFIGYGGEDNDFWLRMEAFGLRPEIVNIHPIHLIHPSYGNNMQQLGFGEQVKKDYEQNLAKYWKTYNETKGKKR